MKKIRFVLLLLVWSILIIGFLTINNDKKCGYEAATYGIYKTGEKTSEGYIYLTDDLKIAICGEGYEYILPTPPLMNMDSRLDCYRYFHHDGYVYYAYVNSTEEIYYFYRYNLQTRHNEDIGSIKYDSSRNENLKIYTANGESILVVVGRSLYNIDILTGVKTELLTIENEVDCIGIMNEYLVYSDIRGCVLYNISDKSENILEDINTVRFALFDNKLYYADVDNGGKLSIYHFDVKEIERSNASIVTGFGVSKEGIEVN